MIDGPGLGARIVTFELSQTPVVVLLRVLIFSGRISL